MDSTKIAPDKLAAYEATHYRIGMDAKAPVLRIGVRSEELARMQAEAGVACSRFAPDWMFVDASVGMSEIVGLVSVLRAEGSPCRVVVMGHTFLAQDETALRGAGVGMILRKPFTLRAAVDLLDRRRYAAAG